MPLSLSLVCVDREAALLFASREAGLLGLRRIGLFDVLAVTSTSFSVTCRDLTSVLLSLASDPLRLGFEDGLMLVPTSPWTAPCSSITARPSGFSQLGGCLSCELAHSLFCSVGCASMVATTRFWFLPLKTILLFALLCCFFAGRMKARLLALSLGRSCCAGLADTASHCKPPA